MAWIVAENTPGYLPDSDPDNFDTIEEARARAAGLATELEEQGYTISTKDDDGDFYFAEKSGEGSENDLGRVIEVMEVPEIVADLMEL